MDDSSIPAGTGDPGRVRLATGLRNCVDAWLASGSPRRGVMNLGHHTVGWKI